MPVIFYTPNSPSFCTKPQLSVLHDQILHKFGKFCMKFGQFDFGWGSASDPDGGAYSALPDHLAGFKGLLLKEGEGRGEERVKNGRGHGREVKGGER